MSVKKRTYRSGKTVWCYIFDAPGSGRQNRRQIKGSGYASKREATDAEAERRIQAQREFEIKQAVGGVDAPLPRTFGSLLDEFLAEYADKNLAAKTAERYREQAGYI